MPRKKSYITLTDQFCGAGGSSIGATNAGAEVRLAMNHWKLAIETHNTNFPNVDHDCTDISAVDPRRYPSTDILITSPECTNHSVAKGKPRRYYTNDLFGNCLVDPAAERSRATMWDVPRFAEYHDYRVILVENVVDAGKWVMWDAWLSAMHALGYEHQPVYFNSMFAWPTPQSRDRLYTIFWKKGNRAPDLEFRPLAYCQKCDQNVEAVQTWKKRPRWGRYKFQYFYRCPSCNEQVVPYHYAGFNAIDFNIPSKRIGDREVPLKPKTLERVKYGLDAFGRQVTIVTGRYTSGVECRVKNANTDPIPTQPGDASHAVVLPWLVETAHTQANGKYVIGSDSAIPTQTTGQTLALVSGFLSKQYGGGADPKYMSVGLNEPTGTITTWDHHALVSLPQNMRDDLLCLTTGQERHSLVSSKAFLSYYYGSNQASQLADPIGTVRTKDHVALVQALDSLKVEDLYFRMLHPHEIGKAMAFPDSYVVLGNGRDKVKQYGNAVTPPVMTMLIERCMATLQ